MAPRPGLGRWAWRMGGRAKPLVRPESSSAQLTTMHGEMAAILAGALSVASLFGTPTSTNITQSATNARMKCATDPADITIVRCQTGNRHMARSSSPGSTSSSCGVIPTILTNPPRGSAFTPYSVSPFRNDHSVGPKPTK